LKMQVSAMGTLQMTKLWNHSDWSPMFAIFIITLHRQIWTNDLEDSMQIFGDKHLAVGRP
jgi:hypothetical protein